MKYINAKETVKLIRKSLKEAFPGTRFYVRRDGNSVQVRWTDGPARDMVMAVIDRFAGEGFDGMTDLRYSRHVRDTLTGERVSFGTAFVFPERAFSPDALTSLRQLIAEQTGCTDWPASKPYGWPKSAGEVYSIGDSFECRDWARTVQHIIAEFHTVTPPSSPPPTAARFEPIRETP